MKVIISPAKKKNQVPEILEPYGRPVFLPGVQVLLEWLQDHLRILSGFYGILRPLDGITPYRLEMQSRLPGFSPENLYEYWGRKLYDALAAEEDHLILNLASKEYSRCITRFEEKGGPAVITCVFGEESGGKVIEKGTLAKMARGDMVRFLAGRHIEDAAGVRSYTGLGYAFRHDQEENAADNPDTDGPHGGGLIYPLGIAENTEADHQLQDQQQKRKPKAPMAFPA